jgi:hypothetical protein
VTAEPILEIAAITVDACSPMNPVRVVIEGERCALAWQCLALRNPVDALDIPESIGK